MAEEWGNPVINNFLDRVEEVLEKIRSNPELYSIHPPVDKAYKCGVHKRLILYYKIVDVSRIDLLTFWNTYQDRDKLKV